MIEVETHIAYVGNAVVRHASFPLHLSQLESGNAVVSEQWHRYILNPLCVRPVSVISGTSTATCHNSHEWVDECE